MTNQRGIEVCERARTKNVRRNGTTEEGRGKRKEEKEN